MLPAADFKGAHAQSTSHGNIYTLTGKPTKKNGLLHCMHGGTALKLRTAERNCHADGKPIRAETPNCRVYKMDELCSRNKICSSNTYIFCGRYLSPLALPLALLWNVPCLRHLTKVRLVSEVR